jgi:hypothetical protein
VTPDHRDRECGKLRSGRSSRHPSCQVLLLCGGSNDSAARRWHHRRDGGKRLSAGGDVYIRAAQAAAIAVVALFAVPIALPTFFEVPVALGLLTAGAPVGPAAALLFAGPAVNLPFLLTVARSAGWKVAGGVAVMVWVAAVVGGLLVN